MVRSSPLPKLRKLTRTAWTWLLLLALLPGVVVGAGASPFGAAAGHSAPEQVQNDRSGAHRALVAAPDAPAVVRVWDESSSSALAEALDEEDGEDTYLAVSEVSAAALMTGSRDCGIRAPTSLRRAFELPPACARGPPIG